MFTHLPAPYMLGQRVFGGKLLGHLPQLYRIEQGKEIDRAMTPMENTRSPWEPQMRRSRYDEDDEDFEEDEFDDDEDLDDDEFDDDDLFDDDDEDLDDDEFDDDDEDEDLF